MDGGDGDDIMLGDNGTITPFIDDKARTILTPSSSESRGGWAMAVTVAATAAVI